MGALLNWEFDISRWKLSCTECVNNKVLQYSTGNSIQYPVINHSGKEYEKECVSLLPGGSDGEESACNAGDPGSMLGLGRSPREGIVNTFQHSCLENSMGRGNWWAIVHGFAKSLT